MKKDKNDPRNNPPIPKEYENMMLLLENAIEWRNRDESKLEKQTLKQLEEYISNFTEERD